MDGDIALDTETYDTKPGEIKMSFKGRILEPLTCYYGAFFDEHNSVYEAARIRTTALRNLWQAALDSVVIRYPNPAVKVVSEITVADTLSQELKLRLVMVGLPDTFNPEKKHSSFLMYAYIRKWPGYRAAQAYIAAVWGLYLQHEAFELVTLKDRVTCTDECDDACSFCQRRNMPIDPHDSPSQSHNQHLIQYECHDIEKLLAWAMGEHGTKMLVEDTSRALADLKNETEYVQDPWCLT